MDSSSGDFTWVVADLLGATRQPTDSRRAFEFFKDEGIDVVVSLTELPLNSALIEEFGFEYHHLPVRDFTAPSARQIERFVRIVDAARRLRRKAVVHCLAGRGRTGTMLACYLVAQGRTPEGALKEIRDLRPGSVETREQEEAVYRHAHRLRRKKR